MPRTPSAAPPPEKKEEFDPYVEWVGSAGQRDISEEAWQKAGVDGQGSVVWTRENPRLPLSQLTQAAIQRLAEESDFVFVLEPSEGK